MATFLMIAGAAHSAWAWERVNPLLAAAGHRPITPDLPGMGADRSIPAGEATLEIWGDFLADQVRAAGEPVILVGHSRGGLVIGEAAERVPEQMRGLIYVTALLVPPGKTANEVMGAETTAHAPPLCEDGKAFYLTAEQATPLFFNACDPAEAAWACGHMTPEPLQPIATPASVTWERWGRLPRAYVECARDQCLSLERQAAIQAPAPCDPVIRLDTDHSPFLSDPKALTDALIAIAATM
jgi:pimeloyl-ACP methyl ester carboxylesterase